VASDGKMDRSDAGFFTAEGLGGLRLPRGAWVERDYWRDAGAGRSPADVTPAGVTYGDAALAVLQYAAETAGRDRVLGALRGCAVGHGVPKPGPDRAPAPASAPDVAADSAHAPAGTRPDFVVPPGRVFARPIAVRPEMRGWLIEKLLREACVRAHEAAVRLRVDEAWVEIAAALGGRAVADGAEELVRILTRHVRRATQECTRDMVRRAVLGWLVTAPP